MNVLWVHTTVVKIPIVSMISVHTTVTARPASSVTVKFAKVRGTLNLIG